MDREATASGIATLDTLARPCIEELSSNSNRLIKHECTMKVDTTITTGSSNEAVTTITNELLEDKEEPLTSKPALNNGHSGMTTSTSPTSKRKRKKRPRNRNKKIDNSTPGDIIEEWIQQRPNVEELLIRNILKADDYVNPKQFKESFERFLISRPTRDQLIKQNYIAETKLANSLRGTQQELSKKLHMDNINRSLKHRPSVEYLINNNILKEPLSPDTLGDTKADIIARLLSTRPSLHDLKAANVIQDIYLWAKIHVPKGNSPSGRNCHTLTACNERLYLFGGANSGRAPGLTSVFDFDLNQWLHTYADGPNPDRRYAHTAADIDGKIWYFGGYACDGAGSGGRWMNDVHVMSVEPRPSEICGQTERAGSLDSNISTASEKYLESTERKKIESKIRIKWDRLNIKKPRPLPRAAHACAAIDKDLYIFGGNDGNTLFNDTWKLDTKRRKWQLCDTSGTAPSPRAGHSASAYENKLFVFGGGGGWGGDTNNDFFVLDCESYVWYRPTYDGMAPSPRAGHSATVCNSKMFIFAGGDLRRVFNDLFVLDLESMTWSRPTDAGNIPAPRVGHATALVGQHLIVFGGGNSEGRHFNDMLALDTAFSPDEVGNGIDDEIRWPPPSNIRSRSSSIVADGSRVVSGTRSPISSWSELVKEISKTVMPDEIDILHESRKILNVSAEGADAITQLAMLKAHVNTNFEKQDKVWNQLFQALQTADIERRRENKGILDELARLGSLLEANPKTS